MPDPFVQYLLERSLVPETAASQLIAKTRYVREPIGMIAVAHGLLLPDEIDVILEHQRESKQRFGEIGVELGFLNRGQVDTLVKIQLLRNSLHIAEALALAEVLSFDETMRYLGAFLIQDEEVIEMMAEK